MIKQYKNIISSRDIRPNINGNKYDITVFRFLFSKPGEFRDRALSATSDGLSYSIRSEEAANIQSTSGRTDYQSIPGESDTYQSEEIRGHSELDASAVIVVRSHSPNLLAIFRRVGF